MKVFSQALFNYFPNILIKIFLSISIFLIAFNANSKGGLLLSDKCMNVGSFEMQDSIIIPCCAEAKEKFGTLWDTGNPDCACSNFNNINEEISIIERGIIDNDNNNADEIAYHEKEIGAAIDRFKEQKIETFNNCVSKVRKLKQICITSCDIYIGITTNGCREDISHQQIKTQCQNLCKDKETFKPHEIVAGIQGYAETSFNKQIFEDNIMSDRRTSCIEKSKDKFVKKYKAECIKRINAIKGTKTLLCKDGVSKAQAEASCEEYCTAKAGKAHGNIRADQIVSSFNTSSQAIAYRALAINTNNALQQYNSSVNQAVEEGLGEDFDGNEITPSSGESEARTLHFSEGNKFHLSWWKCQKGASPKMACESDLELALNEAVLSCAELQSAAQECCHNPESCVGGGLATAMDGLGKLNVGLSAFRGPQAQCDAVQQTHGLYSGMQGAMAAQCTNKSNECVRGCQEKVDKVSEAFKAACDEYPTSGVSHDTGRHTCDADFFNDYKKAYTSSENEKQVSISSVPDKCKTTGKEANRRINDMTTNAGTSLLASMKECGWDGSGNWKSSFSGGPTGMNVLPSEDDNTTTGSSSTGGGIQIPDLPTPTTTVGGGGNEEEERRGLLPDGLTAQQAVSPFDMEPGSGGEPEEGPPAPAGKMGGLLGGSGGGGGSGLGGLGGGGSSGGRGRSGSGAGAKKGKKVLLGYRGGKFKGYGGGAGGSASGGSRASSRRSASKKGRGMASLDLKKLLPKGKQLNNKIGKYGSPHDDIFKRLSDRIQWMCRTRRINCK